MIKVCVIADVHGTTKFLDCYNDILKNDNDCKYIIVLGDHFDPYEEIPVDELIEKYNEFIDISKKDNRIISCLGNHDLATYVINDSTNRTERFYTLIQKISDAVIPNMKDSYLAFKIGNYIFSHAGVSKVWLEDIGEEYANRIMNNCKGWTQEELDRIVGFYPEDFSYYGDNVHQGCTWIRPDALNNSAIDGYNQVVGHTQVYDITKIKMKNGMDLWLTDNERRSEYLTLEIEGE